MIKKKIGNLYEGIPVISFETYLEKYRTLPIIISIYSRHYFDCVGQMKRNGITDYFTSPPVIYGMKTPEEFAESNGLEKSRHVVFYGSNPITERIETYLRSKGNITIDYINSQSGNIRSGKHVIQMEDLQKEDTLVLTTNEAESPVRGVINKSFEGKIADIYQFQETRKERYLYLEQYKDIYKGRRCFVIGNGPSLNKKDLAVLENNQEISFAANGIFHMYDKVTWRPTHYMLCDAIAYKTMYEDIKKTENENAFIADFYHTDFGEIHRVNRFYLINKLNDSDEFEFSDDAVKGFYSGRTITYVMIQMACYMGIKEIYLLGVDWTGGKGTGKGRLDFYEGDKGQAENNSTRFDLFMEEKYAFESARRYTEAHGIKIYNATRGGELEVFERVEFDSLF